MFRLLFIFRSVVVNSGFIHTSTQKFAGLTLVNQKSFDWNSFGDNFRSTVSKRVNHQRQSISKLKCSGKILHTGSVDFVVVSVMSLTFNLRSSIIILWIFSIIPGVVTSTGRPECDSSEVLLRHFLNSETHYLTIKYDEEEETGSVEDGFSLICRSVSVRPAFNRFRSGRKTFTPPSWLNIRKNGISYID